MGGLEPGIGIMDSNDAKRTALARYALSREDFKLARRLLSSITDAASVRDAYRATTLHVARGFGRRRAVLWVRETVNSLEFSGGVLGLAEFLQPPVEDADSIPKTFR